MTSGRNCRSCGTRLTYLQGATGRVSFCSRCGWGMVELAEGYRSQVLGPVFGPSPVTQQARAEVSEGA